MFDMEVYNPAAGISPSELRAIRARWLRYIVCLPDEVLSTKPIRLTADRPLPPYRKVEKRD
jgi:hypothetical protein